MKISNQQLIGWQATPDMASWFLIRFPDGDTEYQDVLTALAEDDRPDDAQWLMDNAGADNCGRFDLTDFETHKHVFAAGALYLDRSLSIGGWIRAGTSIEAAQSLCADHGIVTGGNIRAGGSLYTKGGIKAGSRIDAGRNIEAGEGITSACAILAGGDIRTGKEINAGTEFNLLVEALEALNDNESENARRKWLVLQKLWGASNGSSSLWDAIVADRNAFGLEAAGGIVSGAGITSATTIKAGDCIVSTADLQAGRTIHAGGNISAGQSVVAGWGISANGAIHSGMDIVATSICAKAGINVQRDIKVASELESGTDIKVAGNIESGTKKDNFSTITAKWEIRVGGGIQCYGNIRAARIEVGEGLFTSRSIRTEGDVWVGKQLEAGADIRSGANIRVGMGIQAGKEIQAGRSIRAGQEIVVGEDYGISAATALPLSRWGTNGQVRARKRPDNLISGHWVEMPDQDNTAGTANALDPGN